LIRPAGDASESPNILAHQDFRFLTRNYQGFPDGTRLKIGLNFTQQSGNPPVMNWEP
jgi:hypothetical protein